MRVRNIGEGKDIQLWAAAIANLFAEQIITPDIDTENWAREQVDMPIKLGLRQTPIQKTPTGGGFGEGPGGQKNTTPSQIRSGNVGKADGEA
jgi:hypothetical protein